MKPKGLVLHYVGNPNTPARNNANYFHNVNLQASVHYVVDDKEIYEIIPPNYISYGTDNPAYNHNYIQIEMCHPDITGRITEATLNNTIWLCQKLIKEYNLTDIVRHYDASTKHKKCPLWYVNNPNEWDKLKERILKGGDIVTYDEFKTFMEQYEAEKREKKVNDYATEAWDKMKELGVMDGTAPQSPMTREQVATIIHRLGVI